MSLALQKIIVRAIFFIMINKRLQFFIIILFIIASGIISRKIPFIPFFIGDLIYAVMVYFIFRMLFLRSPHTQIGILSLAFCFLIECFQLYQGHWIIEIRKTLLGHLVLGEGFLWSDLFAYFLGTFVGILFDKNIGSTKQSS